MVGAAYRIFGRLQYSNVAPLMIVLAARLGEGQIAELVQDHEVKPCQKVGDAAVAGGAGLALEPVHEVDHVVEPGPGVLSSADVDPLKALTETVL